MTPVLTAAQMRFCDEYAEKELGLSAEALVANAAAALRRECLSMFCGKAGCIAILCGPGNNGADGFCLAKMLKDEGFYTETVAVFGLKGLSSLSAIMAERVGYNDIIDARSDIDSALKAVANADIVVDCIFGTGFKDRPDPEAQALMRAASSRTVIAADIPSGIICDSGKAVEYAVKAAKTVTFAAYKPFCFLYPAKDFCGQIILADIGLPRQAFTEAKPAMFALDDEILSIIKRPSDNTHKGSFGAVQTVCGCRTMTGAAVLCADAALHSGAGMVYMTADKKLRSIFQTQLKEPVYVPYRKPTKATAYVIGCGLGKNAKKMDFYLSQAKPAVIDADAITYISKHRRLLEYLSASDIITPHPAEMARLLGTDTNSVEDDRISAASEFAKEHGLTVVLKGHHTLIALPDGRIYINTSGNPALSKAGSGDVLAGLIGGLLAQQYSPAEAAMLGVYLHGKAADVLSDRHSRGAILPSDLPAQIGEFIY